MSVPLARRTVIPVILLVLTIVRVAWLPLPIGCWPTRTILKDPALWQMESLEIVQRKVIITIPLLGQSVVTSVILPAENVQALTLTTVPHVPPATNSLRVIVMNIKLELVMS